MCIVSTNQAAVCPASFPARHVLGDAVSDTRACNASCTCGLTAAGTCTTPQLELYDANGCNVANRTANIAANNACNNVGWGNSESILSAKYTSTASGAACGAPALSPTGTLTVTNPRIACCR
jgi:hypothetical protein